MFGRDLHVARIERASALGADDLGVGRVAAWAVAEPQPVLTVGYRTGIDALIRSDDTGEVDDARALFA